MGRDAIFSIILSTSKTASGAFISIHIETKVVLAKLYGITILQELRLCFNHYGTSKITVGLA